NRQDAIMRAQRFNRGARLLLLGALIVLGCKKPAPPPAQETAAPTPAAPTGVAVASIQLGSQIGADKSVTAPKSTFAPHDTIYAVVSTTGVATDASLEAIWTYVGSKEKQINQASQSISPTGPAQSEFHLAKPTPWPEGKYRVAILLNGATAGTKDFEVKR
ncbi:MAG TPA: hypothetical protein VLB12_17890, partial [Gemmatimonadales bacterium]|nr:hypothetical protein [Gemmatimonadales bacterium]